MRRKKNQIVEAQITRMGKDGHGIGHYTVGDGSTREVEVPFTVPGDTAEALLLRKRKGILRSLLEEVTTPSPDRVPPRCAHFASCGGCRWQQTDYSQQLAWKEEGIRRNLEGVEIDRWHPIIGCEPPWNYRNKMEFSFSQNAAGDRFLGLMLSGSRGKVATLSECHIGPTWSAEAIERALNWWKESGLAAYFPPRDEGTLRTLTIREGVTSGDRMVVLLVSGNPDFAPKQEQLKAFVKAMAPLKQEGAELTVVLRVQQALAGKPTQFYEMIMMGSDHYREELTIAGHPFKLMVSPTAFFQPNSRQAEILYNRALELAEIPEGGLVYDLYCGTGTLGLFASTKAAKVVGIELSPESSLDARENAKANGRENIEVVTGDVGRVLQEREGEKPDLVMVDPPRSGLDPRAMHHLTALSPNRLLYVSCNPKTQGENLRELQTHGYRVTDLQPVDQFPQTPHVETIALLAKNK